LADFNEAASKEADIDPALAAKKLELQEIKDTQEYKDMEELLEAKEAEKDAHCEHYEGGDGED
jgi:hypothetical protein